MINNNSLKLEAIYFSKMLVPMNVTTQNHIAQDLLMLISQKHFLMSCHKIITVQVDANVHQINYIFEVISFHNYKSQNGW